MAGRRAAAAEGPHADLGASDGPPPLVLVDEEDDEGRGPDGFELEQTAQPLLRLFDVAHDSPQHATATASRSLTERTAGYSTMGPTCSNPSARDASGSSVGVLHSNRRPLLHVLSSGSTSRQGPMSPAAARTLASTTTGWSLSQPAPDACTVLLSRLPPATALMDIEKLAGEAVSGARDSIVECGLVRRQGGLEGQIQFDSPEAALRAEIRLRSARVHGSAFCVTLKDCADWGPDDSANTRPELSSPPAHGEDSYWCAVCEIDVKGPPPVELMRETHENGGRHLKCLRLGPPSRREAMRPQGEALRAALLDGTVPATSADEAVIAFPEDLILQEDSEDGQMRLCVVSSKRNFKLYSWKNALQHLLHIRSICPYHYFDKRCDSGDQCSLFHDVRQAPAASQYRKGTARRAGTPVTASRVSASPGPPGGAVTPTTVTTSSCSSNEAGSIARPQQLDHGRQRVPAPPAVALSSPPPASPQQHSPFQASVAAPPQSHHVDAAAPAVGRAYTSPHYPGGYGVPNVHQVGLPHGIQPVYTSPALPQSAVYALPAQPHTVAVARGPVTPAQVQQLVMPYILVTQPVPRSA
eukprot:TRINITY_DN60345_c0_g1_i1.p1 TRINITY_DN60345_c0_g1~~TRINITY_DN60345_c0_g1_i1.p1  ORF type:complete len:583 (+),score=100.67 TRINITY_DN60345_c0_g1_i1:205-1953(+)